MKTNKEAYENAAGMNLENGFFTFNGIDPDAEYQGAPLEKVLNVIDKWSERLNVVILSTERTAMAKDFLEVLPKPTLAAVGVCAEIDEYLSSNPLNTMGSMSILHRRLRDALGLEWFPRM